MEEVKYPQKDIKILKGWESLLARPGMYIGKKSLYGLQCFIYGMEMGVHGPVCGGPPYNKFFDMSCDDWCDFIKWVREKTKYSDRNTTYTIAQDLAYTIAQDLASQDDEKAFDIWVAWFKEWKAL